MPIYKDEQIEFMSKEEALWLKIKEAREQSILEHEVAAEIDREILKYAKLKLEKDKV